MIYARRYLLGTTAALIGVLTPAAAAAQIRRFDVPAQPAQTGIPLFAHQAGIQILAPGAITEGLSVKRVRGSMQVSAALRLLLSGTDLVPVTIRGAIVLKRQSLAQNRLPERHMAAITMASAAVAPQADTTATEVEPQGMGDVAPEAEGDGGTSSSPGSAPRCNSRSM